MTLCSKKALSSLSPRVVLAMSGGVDSSVAAILLLRAGFEVLGITMHMWPVSSGADRASQVAARLGISHKHIDTCRDFEEKVLKTAWKTYAQGLTPNPCAVCNPLVKFQRLQEEAELAQAGFLATGHHARILCHPTTKKYELLRGKDIHKDQSYFLYRLPNALLARVLFPVGGMLKSEVRSLAREFGLPNADDPESQDTCLPITSTCFAETLREKFKDEARPGHILDDQGHVLGQHQGLHRYTIGQRRGLGLALGEKAYVVEIKKSTNQIILSSHPQRLFSKTLEVSGLCWQEKPEHRFEASVQIRYRHNPAPAEIEWLSQNRVLLRFKEAQRAITPGQAAVFYAGDKLLGGGWIDRIVPEDA